MQSWSLARKIWSIIALLTFAFVACVGLSLHRIGKMKDNTDEITNVLVKRVFYITSVRAAIRKADLLNHAYFIERNEAKKKETKKSFEETYLEIETNLKSYKEIASEKGREYAGKFSEKLAQWRAVVDRLQAHVARGEEEQARELFNDAHTFQSACIEDLENMKTLTQGFLDERSAESNHIAKQALWLVFTFSLVSILTALIVTFLVVRTLTGNIRQVVAHLTEGSTQVGSAAAQIASSAQQLSASSGEQAASLEETAASIEEMNSMVRKNSQNAQASSTNASESQRKATEGQAVVERMIQSMDKIAESNTAIMSQVNESNAQMASIVKVIEEIGTKTKVINDIVFQTKLLSFNASVEAARAGENGKGFAVVAEEVGNLAQMSGNAAKEISTLLDTSITKVNQIVAETKGSVEKLVSEGKQTIQSGTTVARECGAMLDEIVAQVGNVTQMAGEIAVASDEQSKGVQEISKAMGVLDQTTQQNAAASEECASAAEELSAQAKSLRSAVQKLQITVEGGVVTNAPVAHPAAPRAPAPRPAPKSAPKKEPVVANNVVHLKRPTEAASVSTGTTDEIPSYDHVGFKDV